MTADRAHEAKQRAVERGVPPFPNVPPGYRRGEGGTLEPDPRTAAAVAEAFRLRADGATVMAVREHLRARGVERSFHGVQSLLGSRIVLGELHFGAKVNESAHPAIVDAVTWQRVQKIALPRGRRPVSDRLLARLGILRCGTCGARMVVGTTRQNGKPYSFYRCPPNADCQRRVTISAEVAESTVARAVHDLLADVSESASVEAGADEAECQLQARQAELDAAIRTLAPVADEKSARERLSQLRQARDEAAARLADLVGAAGPAVTVSAGDWNTLTLAERRALIRATIAEATVAPGRGTDRIAVKPV